MVYYKQLLIMWVWIISSGLDNQKFYTQKRDPKAEDEIAHTNDVDDFNKREAVYAANRAALAHQIR